MVHLQQGAQDCRIFCKKRARLDGDFYRALFEDQQLGNL
jgi:hypothetical protein